MKTIEDYNREIEQDPNNAELYRLRGIVYQRNWNFEQAKNDFTRSIDINPSSSQAYINRGVTFEMMDISGEAEKDYNKATEIDPKNPDGYFNRGHLYHTHASILYSNSTLTEDEVEAANNVEESNKFRSLAIADFEKAIALNGNDANFYIFCGMAYKAQKNYKAAKDRFKRAIELDPSNSHAHLGLGDVYRNEKQFALAIEQYEKAIKPEPYPNNVFAYNALALLLYQDMRNFVEAAKYWEKVLKIDPNDSTAKLFLPDVYECMKSISGFDEFIKLYPNDAPAYSKRGLLHERNGDYNKAIDDYSEAIHCGYTFLYNSRGKLYLEQGNYKEAIADFEAALKIDRDDGFAKQSLEQAVSKEKVNRV
jgi:tetratricopeptide (TPR) repeat protein